MTLMKSVVCLQRFFFCAVFMLSISITVGGSISVYHMKGYHSIAAVVFLRNLALLGIWNSCEGPGFQRDRGSMHYEFLWISCRIAKACHRSIIKITRVKNLFTSPNCCGWFSSIDPEVPDITITSSHLQSQQTISYLYRSISFNVVF